MVGEVDSAKVVNTHIGGLITEASPLNFPENATTDELNCSLLHRGNRRRRLGVDYEKDSTLSTTTLTDAEAKSQSISSDVWTSVRGSGTRNFQVVQIDTTLHFYDLDTVPLSAGKKSFTQDISTFAASGATNTGTEPITMVSGRGLLFCASKKLEPFYIEYDEDTDTITSTQIALRIRDFDGLDEDPELANDEEPSALSISHNYNLKNQGWVESGNAEPDPIGVYFNAEGVYPANNKQWWVAKNSTGVFTPSLLTASFGGTTLAPRGHFLLNPFNKEREASPPESEENRPEVLAFFAGRIWYMGVDSSNINGHVFFSQIVLKPEVAGKCYQDSDPTAEEISELLDTDGGVVVIPEIGKVIGAIAKDKFLIIFASNGVWSITGGTDSSGFKATSFQVQKMTNVGVVGKDSIIDTEGFPVWWSTQGIYTMGTPEGSSNIETVSLSERSIETFYQDKIPEGSKTYSRGLYDLAAKRIYWLYNTKAPTGTANRWKFNALLVYDMSIKAFYPWKIPGKGSDTPYIVDVFDTQRLNKLSTVQPVVIEGSVGTDTLVDGSGNTITLDVQQDPGNFTFLQYLAIVPNPNATTNTWVFAEFNDSNFYDWRTNDSIGSDYSSYFETGYEIFESLTKKQTPYIQFFFNKTETGVSNSTLLNPSSCFMQTKWDWTSLPDAGKWSELQQIYKLKREFDSGVVTTHLPGVDVINSEIKVRGHGKAVQLRFESEAGKDFDLAGWQSFIDKQGNV